MQPMEPTAPSLWGMSWENETRVVCLVLLVGPLLAGWLLGYLLRRVRGKHLTGGMAMVGSLILPTVLGAVIARTVHGVGTWDGITEGFLLGIGISWASHRAFTDPRPVAMAIVTFTACLVCLEAVSRWVLPIPPDFPAGPPHFFLNDIFRRSDPMFGGGQEHICTLAYPNVYHSRLNPDARATLPVRSNGQPPPEHPTRHVVHLGDSLAYGFSVADNETFEAGLERLEPTVQHTNGAIIGTGPDSYLVVLQRWLTETHVDLAVLYLFEGNDLSEIDKGHPCSGWQPILAYGPHGASLRYPTGPYLSHPLWEYARSTSPPPYLLRAMVRRSTVAAFLAAAISSLQTPDVNAHESDEVRWAHLARILGAARDAAHARGVALAVVVLPWRLEVERGHPGEIAQRMVQVSQSVGLPTLDPGDTVRAAYARGENLFISNGNDSHLNPAGHRVMAQWLHEHLPAAYTRPP